MLALFRVQALAWCPWQSSILASGGGTSDRHIRIWNINSGSCVTSWDTQSQVKKNISTAAEFSDELRIVIGQKVLIL